MSNEELADLFKALSHPLRQAILLHIAENGQVSSSELFDHLKCQSGTLYHHLKLLTTPGLLVQEKGKSYSLSEIGWKSVHILDKELNIQSSHEKVTEEEKQAINYLNKSMFNIIAPKRIFEKIWQDPYFFSTPIILLILLFGYLNSITNIRLMFFFFEIQNDDFFLSTVYIVFSLISITVVPLIVGYFLYPNHWKKKIPFSAPIMAGIALIPLILFPIIAMFDIFVIAGSHFQLAVTIILQSWSTIIIGRMINISFKVSWERGILVSIISIYILLAIHTLMIV